MKKILMIIAAAALITFLMPLQSVEPISVNIGQRWEDADVLASFDTPILKSQALLNEQIASASNQAKPVFDKDTVISRRQIKQFLTDFSSRTDQDTLLRDSVVELIREVYSVGIISHNESQSYQNRAVMVRRGNGNELINCYIGALFTPVSAIAYIEEQADLPVGVITNYINANLEYNDNLSQIIKKSAIDNISPTQGIVHTGDVIIFKGQIVDETTSQIIESYNLELNSRLNEGNSQYLIFILRLVLVFVVLLLNYLFFTKFSVHYFGGGSREMLFIMLMYVLFTSLVALLSRFGEGNMIYIVPLPMVAIYLLTFFNMRVAIIGNVSVAILGAMFAGESYDYFLINFLSGMMAIFMMRHFYHRGKLIRALGSLILSQMVLFLVFELLRLGYVSAINYYTLVWFAVSGLLFLGFYQLVYILERIFGFVSDVTLLELCDTNQPLLMKLAQNAPGTFQHSVQVANLAEGAAKAIGANPLLARTGALYHDIGKMENPFYFVENLSGVFNPHNDCTPYQSADIIKQHVTVGVEIAKKNNLPDSVIQFIESHHGDSLIYFFYDKARKEAQKEGKEIDSAYFRYSGPKPVSREASICMMADAVEAASRSLPSYHSDQLDELVERIVDTQIKDGVFSKSEITFQEIERVKELFKSKLNNIYHGRIAYPVRK